jgi:hypothetical protein
MGRPGVGHPLGRPRVGHRQGVCGFFPLLLITNISYHGLPDRGIAAASADSDLVLSDFVSARTACFSRLAPRHAVIFFDRYAGLFELLNYGADGVVVDNVFYGCDIGDKR